MSSELIERLRRNVVERYEFEICPVLVGLAADALETQAATITALQAELAEARGKALEEAAQEADKWFPADTASRYPKGGIATAIRNMKATAIEARDWSKP